MHLAKHLWVLMTEYLPLFSFFLVAKCIKRYQYQGFQNHLRHSLNSTFNLMSQISSHLYLLDRLLILKVSYKLSPSLLFLFFLFLLFLNFYYSLRWMIWSFKKRFFYLMTMVSSPISFIFYLFMTYSFAWWAHYFQ